MNNFKKLAKNNGGVSRYITTEGEEYKDHCLMKPTVKSAGFQSALLARMLVAPNLLILF